MDTGASVRIHPTALIEPGAELGRNVTVGPFCVVGPHAVIGDNVELMSHVVVDGDTTIGANTRIFPHAVLGTEPQNTAYRGERTTLTIGRNNTIREGVTMHRGTADARATTIVGDNGMFLAYSHVAHDCIVGDHVTFANNVMLGGHVTIGDRAIIGGGAGVHQFCTVGHHAFIGGIAAVAADVIPYGMVIGERCFLAGLNVVGLKRSGMERDRIHTLRRAYKMLFADNGNSLLENAEAIKDEFAEDEAAQDVIQFVLAGSKRHFLTPMSGRGAHRAREAG